MIYYITIFMFFLCVTTMVINLEGHLTPRLYLWEMRKRLIKDSGAWYSLIGREGVRFYRRAAFRRVSHSQGIEQVISVTRSTFLLLPSVISETEMNVQTNLIMKSQT